MKDWRPRLSSIKDPIAEDYWHYMTEDGTQRTSQIIIGRPALAPDGKTWYCPLFFEHVARGIKYSYGVGPVDALMNAMYFVRRRFYEFDEVTPGAKPPRAKSPAATSKGRVKKQAASSSASRPRAKKRVASRKPSRQRS
ncbi:hypothetical protein [Pyxidicoccus sp. MSG2]|uniref:hypothetical protein n=1 Tax=Pyxidicoccus sp. MSG2 TaxID=2996790 RepID=UPI002271C6B1|nr:hypothetical protein [Pyxidicoccus sp. MSG2]MCY1017961.1 hypothetical protein [Pyxidicoccus sp. MSG2]